ncbi:MAG: S41 family peptidase, partial [Planctomycetota bacterium]|nr:S41 family peptidase [Planctomycetota bacterium]
NFSFCLRTFAESLYQAISKDSKIENSSHLGRRTMKHHFIILLSALFLLSCPGPSMARGKALSHKEAKALLDEAWGLGDRLLVHKSILKKRNWPSLKEKYSKQLTGKQSKAEVYALINEMLGELQVSHLVLMHEQVFQRHLNNEFRKTAVPLLGFEVFELQDQYFVSKVLEGSAAKAAGLKVGDELVQFNKKTPHLSKKFFNSGHDRGLPGPHGYVFLVENKEEVTLTIRKSKSGPSQQLTIKANLNNQFNATKASIRIIKEGSHKIGVLHLWHLLHKDTVPLIKTAIEKTFKDADGIILDIRGRGGYSHLGDKIIDFFQGPKAIWNKPVIVLNHRWTRSAKEIFSYRWRKRKAGLIVGERTRGAVYGTIFRKLKDGGWMLIPRSSSTAKSEGLSLELRGVAPDIYVSGGPLKYRQGRDLILLKGLKVIALQIDGKTIPKDWFQSGPMPSWAKLH